MKTILVSTGLAILFVITSLNAQTINGFSTSLTPMHALDFGDITWNYTTGGASIGDVRISASGSRSCDATLVGLNTNAGSQAIISLQLCGARLITIKYQYDGKDLILNRRGGGGTMFFDLGDTNLGGGNNFKFIYPNDCNTPLLIWLGGTLHVKTSTDNPPGIYEGDFYVTFLQE